MNVKNRDEFRKPSEGFEPSEGSDITKVQISQSRICSEWRFPQKLFIQWLQVIGWISRTCHQEFTSFALANKQVCS